MKRAHRYLSLVILAASFFSGAVRAACDDALPENGGRNDVLIIVNDNAIDSCEVGLYYAQKRNLGRANIVHVRTPASFWMTWAEFKQLRDQVIRHLHRRVLANNPTLPAAVCTGTESPYYCAAVVNQVRAYTDVRYLVTTKGLPSRMKVDGSSLPHPDEPTSVDNYLRFWLINYFTTDVAFKELALNRARSFDNGRGMRVVSPRLDYEFIGGRIDGITLDAAKRLVDRTLAAEANGLYGKVYSMGREWKNYRDNSLVYAGDGTPWRYQFGLFAESQPACAAYSDPSHYLNFNYNTAQGKSPQDCRVKMVKPGGVLNDEPAPGWASGRQPVVDDSLFYRGQLDGQASGSGSFSAVMNWRRTATCSNTLCSNLPSSSEQATCRAYSTDVYKEIDTRCVGVADGFVGYNFQSYPLAFFTIPPTGWQTGTEILTRHATAVVRSDVGADDTSSLWYVNREEFGRAVPAVCYSGYDFEVPPSVRCPEQQKIDLPKDVDLGSVRTSAAAAPDRYRLRFKYKAEYLSIPLTLRAGLSVVEAVGGDEVWYGWDTFVDATSLLPKEQVTEWRQAEAILSINHAHPGHVGWDGSYRAIKFHIRGTNEFHGAVALDDFSLAKITATGDQPVALINPTFREGHSQTTAGDHAATYLSRLNGVAFFGSTSHHASSGYSFYSQSLETMLYFMRGLPLGDAVWFAEEHNSGMLYGDPLYSPAAVRLNYLVPGRTEQFVRPSTALALSGANFNGSGTTATITYDISYCRGVDFYTCDTQGTWRSTGVRGVGGARVKNFGSWNTSTLTPGPYTLRLAVTSTHPTLAGRSQTFNDFQPFFLYNDTSDYDADGLTDAEEMAPGSLTSPNDPDMDKDGLLDGREVKILKTNPLSKDSDNDRIFDKLEVDKGLNPLVNDVALDLDGDGVANGIEIAAGTNPLKLTSAPPIKTVYVNSASTNTSPNGSETHPYISLDDALKATISGDTVIIKAGSYTFNQPSLFRKGLRILGDSAANTTIQLQSTFNTVGWFTGEISGLTLKTNSPLITVLDMLGAQNVRVHHVAIVAAATGLRISNAQYITVDHCLVQGTAGNTSAAVQYEVSTHSGPTIIDQCTITGSFGSAINGPSPTGGTGAFLKIKNTIFANSVVIGSHLTSLWPDIHHSLLPWLPSGNTNYIGKKGNLGGSPRFIDAAMGNYQLQADSPAAGTGDPASSRGTEPGVPGMRVNMGYFGGTPAATIARDTDADGLPDGYELSMSLSTTRANTYADSDRDGPTDYVEFWSGSHPTNAALVSPYRYIIMNPKLTGATLVSNVSNNSVAIGNQTYALPAFTPQSFMRLSPTTELIAPYPFSVGSNINATDSATPIHLLGRRFVVPQYRDNHHLYLYSPYATATVTYIVSGVSRNVQVPKGQVFDLWIAGANTQATRLIADWPILVAHAATTGTTPGSALTGDANPVPPAVHELWGVRSSNAYVAALENNTRVMVYSSDGQAAAYTLQAGQRTLINVGNSGSQGQGAGLHLVADKPIAALQTGDQDGFEQTAFLGRAWLTKQVTLPTHAQYIAVVCPRNSTVTIKNLSGTLSRLLNCTPSGNFPGKVYFGSGNNIIAFNAGDYLSSTTPVYVYYENAATSGERNVFGTFDHLDAYP